MKMNRGFALVLMLLVATLFISTAVAQETQAGLQGTVKDPQGLAVSKATIEVTGTALIGSKKAETDSSGYYRFANLPPGDYTITITAPNFKVMKLTGVKLSAGALPTIDPKLEVGAIEQVVEVSGDAPMVDVTTSKVQTTVTKEELDGIPKGRSFQSVIPFAPGARQEPLASRREDSGRLNGFQIDGASDSENVYMSEGLNTTNIQDGGVGRANVPFEFVQEVQVKTSSFEAEFGGALGGVINVVQKRGGPKWHGSAFGYYQGDSLNANDQCITRGFVSVNCGLRLQPGTSTANGSAGTVASPALWATRNDGTAQYYNAKEDKWRTLEPGFEIGGPLLKDRLWLFTSYVPTLTNTQRTVNFAATTPAPGPQSFVRTDTTHNALSRADYRLTDSVRLFGAWQYGYTRNRGINMPATPDSVTGQVNNAAGTDPASFRTETGFTQPLNVLNFGGDWTVTPKFVVQARYGYFYQDTQDRGRPQGTRDVWQKDSVCNLATDPGSWACTGNFTNTPGSGAPVAAGLQHSVGFTNMSSNQQSLFDIYSRKAFTTDASYFVGNFFGTHNFKGGYSVQRSANSVQQAFVTSQVDLFYGDEYTIAGGNPSACNAIIAANGGCRGTMGYYRLRDGVNVNGDVSALNHALYFQDAWTIKGFTINAGIRFDKEFLPPYRANASSVDFGFGDKVAPRIGVAYDVLHNGKVKAYFSYGKFFDIMKYSLPRGSFGGDYWHDCVYTLDTASFNTIIPANVGGRFCPATGGATGAVPGTLIENVDWRASTGELPGDPVVDPNIKPMQQHEYVGGVDWAITPMIGFEARYSRKRLDETIEDIAVSDSSTLFYIGNPGSAFGQVLHRPLVSSGIAAPVCPTCPLQPKAIRDYDGLEFRLTKRASDKWFGSLSYTYSKLNGNYPGLASSYIADGNGGRHSPNNNRSFDAPQMQYDANGRLIDGPLPTDRTNTFKGFAYYRLKWWGQETLFGVTQQIFSGTPLSTCLPTGASASSCQFVEGQGNWVNFHQDPTTHAIVRDGIVNDFRTSAYTQTDLSFNHEVRVSKTNEAMRIGFNANISNLFNQRAILQLNNSPLANGVTTPTTAANVVGYDFQAMMTGWNYIAIMNNTTTVPCTNGTDLCYAGPNVNGRPNTLASRYGQPLMFQGARTIRVQFKFTF
jgi:hypothetical protein